jgi:hypothetical protein
MGYAKGVRLGHAEDHLREPVLALLKAIGADEPRWWQVEDGDGEPFSSPEAAYRHLGRLWHCRDVVPGTYRSIAVDLGADPEPFTYGSLVRWMRPYLVDKLQVKPR